MDIGKGVVDVVFDKDQAAKAANEALLPAFQKLATSAAGLFAAKKMFDFAKAGFAELENAQKVTAQTEVTLRNLGTTSGTTMAEVDKLSIAMLNQSGVDDEVAKSAENVLLRLGATGDAFRRATQDSADLAAAMGTDMVSAAELLGKALAHPEQAARLLKPVIGGLTAAQLELIKNFQLVGDAAGAQGVIFDAVESKVSGSAEAYGKTLPGQLAIAQQSMANAKAELVGGLAPALELNAKLTTTLAHGIQSLPEPLQQIGGGIALVVGAAGSLSAPLYNVLAITGKLKTGNAALAASEGVAAAGAEGLAVAEGAAAAASGGLVAALGPVAVAAAAITAAVVIMRQETVHATADLNGLAKASAAQLAGGLTQLEQIASGTGLAAQAAVAQEDAIFKALVDGGTQGLGVLRNLRDAEEARGQSTVRVDAAIADATRAQENQNRASEAGADTSGTLTTALGKQTTMLEQITTATDKYKEGLDKAFLGDTVQQAVDKRNQDLADLAKSQEDRATKIIDLGRQIADLSSRRGSGDQIRAAQDALEKAQRPLTRTQIAADPTRAADREKEIADATRHLAEVRADASRTTADVARQIADLKAQLAAAWADASLTLVGDTDAARRNRAEVLQLTKDAADVITSNRDTGIKTVAQLEAIRVQEVINLDSQLTHLHTNRAEIQGMIDDINSIPLNHETVLSVKLPQGINNLSDFGKFGVTLTPPLRDSGGPVFAGQPFLFGGGPPELLIPKTDGMVLSNAQLQGLGGSSGGGDSVTIHVDRDSGAVAQDIARELWWRDTVRQLQAVS